MSDLLRQISDYNCSCVTSNYTSSLHFSMEISKNLDNSTITYCECKSIPFSDKILTSIRTLEAYRSLPDNWNSYGAKPPSLTAIRNAIEFLLQLQQKQRNPSLVVPTPDEGIVIELQEGTYRLEFLFNHDNTSDVSGYKGNDLLFEYELNETTESSAIKWLINPNGIRINRR